MFLVFIVSNDLFCMHIFGIGIICCQNRCFYFKQRGNGQNKAFDFYKSEQLEVPPNYICMQNWTNESSARVSCKL
jgi:hypothetical protein